MIPPSTQSDAQNRPAQSPPEPRPQAAGASGRQPFLLRQWRTYPVDTIRRAAVSVAAGAAAVTAYIHLRDGTPLIDDNSTQAAIGPAGSLLAPASAVWWLWAPVAAGWLGYALYQWLPQQRTNPRHDRFGWIILASQLTAFAWLLMVSVESAGGLLSVAAIQIAVGLVAVHSMNLHPPSSGVEGMLADTPLGLSLAAGVLSFIAALAFILTRAEADLAGWGGTVWSLTGLITVMVGITVICMTDRGHLSVALAVVWCLSFVAFERLTGALDSTVVGVGAAGTAFLVLVSAGSRRHRVDHERRQKERRGWVEPGQPGEKADV